jgi:hypothetical protein
VSLGALGHDLAAHLNLEDAARAGHQLRSDFELLAQLGGCVRCPLS